MHTLRLFLLTLSSIIFLGACMPSNAQTNHDDSLPRIINVNGKAEIKAEPDRALIPMGVEARNKELNRARQEVDTAVKNILNMANDLGIDKKRVKSAQLITRPEYNWNSSKKRELIGYYVSRQIEIDLHNLDDLGQLMHGATQLGVTNMNGPQFYSSKKDEIYREALVEASKNAKANARVLAEALDSKLGKVHQINATNVYYNQPKMASNMRSMAADAEMMPQETYQAGEITVVADVNVVFDIDE